MELTSRRAGQTVFAVAFLAVSALLLALIGEETVWKKGTKLAAQPRFWPAVSLGAMVLFAALHLRGLTGRRGEEMRARGAAPFRWGFERAEARHWSRGLEFVAWFAVLILLVPWIGFAPSAIAFAVLLAWRLGYSRRTLFIAAAFALAVVVVFKAGLSVRIPGGALYEWLPAPARSFAILYL